MGAANVCVGLIQGGRGGYKAIPVDNRLIPRNQSALAVPQSSFSLVILATLCKETVLSSSDDFLFSRSRYSSSVSRLALRDLF